MAEFLDEDEILEQETEAESDIDDVSGSDSKYEMSDSLDVDENDEISQWSNFFMAIIASSGSNNQL